MMDSTEGPFVLSVMSGRSNYGLVSNLIQIGFFLHVIKLFEKHVSMFWASLLKYMHIKDEENWECN